MVETLSYAYGILRADADVPRDLAGIAGAALRLVTSGDLAALVSTVDAEEFGERGLRENLEDMRWLERTVRAHSRVVDAVAACAPVAPLALATVYFSDERLRTVLEERASAFEAVLELITGRTEWGVKAYADPSTAENGPADREAPYRPGQAYLGKLRQRREVRAQAESEALQQAEGMHHALSGLAHASLLHPPQNRELAGYRGLMVLNGAYLVDDSRADEFASAVDDLASKSSARIELTGPWPPYSFATLADSRPGRAP